MMMELFFHSCHNLGDYLSLSLKQSFKPSLYNHDTKPVSYSRSLYNRDTQPVSNSRWHKIPMDIMETITQRLNITDRIRMKAVCNSWSQIYKNVCIKAADIPWLMLPQASVRKRLSLSFYSLSSAPRLSFYSLDEGRLHHLKLPKSINGGWCCGCSKGWLCMVKGSDFNPNFFLINPISGSQLNLPSLTTIPCFQNFIDELPYQYNASMFVNRIEVGAEGIVSAIVNKGKVLAFFNPGDKRWSIFNGGRDDDDDVRYIDMLFYNKRLYVSIASDGKGESFETHTVGLTDCELMIHLISDEVDGDNVLEYDTETQPGIVIVRETVVFSYLVQSVHGELLFIRQIVNLFAEEDDEEDEDDETFPRCRYFQTTGFQIFKLNPNSGQLNRLTSLGDQVIFLATMGGSSSLSIKNTNGYGFQGNCIYFTFVWGQNQPIFVPLICRESGVFYLEDGRIERSFPSVKLPIQSRMCWFTPCLD